MKKLLPFLLFLLFSSLKAAHAQTTDWTATSLSKSFVNTVQISPWGLLAGERDTRLWLNPFNGLYISKDLGSAWKDFGLRGRGVTDIDYKDQTIYASTYYFTDNSSGVFKTSNGGQDWIHICNNYSTSAVSAGNDYVLVGTYSQGLWIYKNDGCVQKIVTTEILDIDSWENNSVATVTGKTFISKDNAETWSEIPFLAGKNIKSILTYKNLIFACSDGEKKLYKSTDLGTSFSIVAISATLTCGKMMQHDQVLYASMQTQSNKYSIFKSEDFGVTWQNTNLDSLNIDGNISDLTWLYSNPSYIFANIISKGIYRYTIPIKTITKEPFLDPPWEINKTSELVDKITSFFDHKYPLFGTEPSSATGSTLNYLGIEGTIPYMYYSSHDAIDFEAPYGSSVLAAADGTATYYYCSGCGNTIKINHNNNYQSVYMHLQFEDLVTTSGSVTVNKGDPIGKVGLTGNTSGPHIHFGISKDLNQNNNFVDDYVAGKTDPFGWQNKSFIDPWSLYSWADSLGVHTGASSSYLWTLDIPEKDLLIPETETNIQLENKTLIIGQNSSEFNYSLFLKNYVKPHLPEIQKNLSYIPFTSMLVNALDTTGNEVETFQEPIIIKVNLGSQDLANILIPTLHIYFWNTVTSLWVALESTYDPQTQTISSQTDHLSHFAVFGESSDATPPQTSITINAQEFDGWYISQPTITLSSEENATTVYSLNKGETWLSHLQPFILDSEGISTLWFKSIDSAGNMEVTNELVLKINTVGKWNKKIKVLQAGFST